MPLFPTKNRTISLTIERPASEKANPAGVLNKFVSQFLPSTGIGGALVNAVKGKDVNSTLSLIGPTSLDINFEADIAIEQGLFTSFMQPWSMNVASVNIKGESYLGAFPLLSNADSDVADILSRFNSTLRDFSGRLGTPGTGRRIMLEIRGNPAGSRRFMGFIRRLHFGESVSASYMLPYEIDFVGRPIDEAKIQSGREGGRRSLERMGGRLNG